MSRAAIAETEAAELIRLRREVRELREEVAEWRRRGDNLESDIDDETMLERIRAFLDDTPSTAAYLAHLLAHAGRVCTKRSLYACAGGQDADIKVVSVFIYRLRVALSERGFPDAITTVWARGYSIDGAVAHRIRAAIQASAPATDRLEVAE